MKFFCHIRGMGARLAPPWRMAALCVSLWSVLGLGQPVNDDFANRIVLTNAVVDLSCDFRGATIEPDERSLGLGASLWWTWTAPITGEARFTIDGTAALLRLYRGDSLAELENLVPGIEWHSIGSPSVISVQAGDVVQICLASPFAAGTLNFHLRNYPLLTAPNDSFAGRLPLPENYEGFVSLANSSVEPGEPALRGELSGPAGTLWWTYTAPYDGMVNIQYGGPDGIDLVLYRGEDLANLQVIQAGGGYLEVVVKAGEIMQLRAAGSSVEPRPIQLQVISTPPPKNDNFANRIGLEGKWVEAFGSHPGGTLEPGERRVAANSPGWSVWYSWLAPYTGRASPKLYPDYDGKDYVAVYTGMSLDRLTQVRRTTDRDRDFLAIGGTVYQFQIDAPTHRFHFLLSVAPDTVPSNDSFANAAHLRGSRFQVRSWLSGATHEPGEPAHLGAIPAKSVWWQWTPSSNARYTFRTDASLIAKPTIAIYTGSSVDALTLVTHGAGGVTLDVQGGQSYYLAGVAPQTALGDIDIASSPGVSLPKSLPVRGNLLRDPSFERFDSAVWAFLNCLGSGGPNSADGVSWLSLGAKAGVCWQYVPTVPGHTYEIRFALRQPPKPPWLPTATHVLWDSAVLGTAAAGGQAIATDWTWSTFRATATSSLSELRFENLEAMAELDAISVVSLSEPPVIIIEPQAVSAFPHQEATFQVGAQGTGPLAYQWFFNGEPIANGNQRVLHLTSVTASNAGSYHVIVSSPHGTVASARASLTLLEAQPPVIVLQPNPDAVPRGTYLALFVAAAGTGPFTYQWFLNEQPIAGATASELVLSAVQDRDAGRYTVTVSNSTGSVTSLPATLMIQDPGHAGTSVRFNNWSAEEPEIRALVFDVDGQTPAEGPGLVAQIYAGPSLDTMRPCGEPSPFQTGLHAGEVVERVVLVPHVQPDTMAYVELRAWEQSYGASYEEARAKGGRFGRSQTLHSRATPRAFLAGLQSFCLRPGVPSFTAGELEAAEPRPAGASTWRLRGHPGSRYRIETAGVSMDWKPLLVLTNGTGTITFVDSSEPEPDPRFYRARLVD